MYVIVYTLYPWYLFLDKGLSIKDVCNLKWFRGEKFLEICQFVEVRNYEHERGDVKILGKSVDVIYGWALT